MLKNDHYTYRVTWSGDDNEHVGLCAEFQGLSWLDNTPEAALKGIRKVVAEVVIDMEKFGEKIPEPLAEKKYSGKFMVRLLPVQAENGDSFFRIKLFPRRSKKRYIFIKALNKAVKEKFSVI